MAVPKRWPSTVGIARGIPRSQKAMKSSAEDAWGPRFSRPTDFRTTRLLPNFINSHQCNTDVMNNASKMDVRTTCIPFLVFRAARDMQSVASSCSSKSIRATVASAHVGAGDEE
jgi:hypothetical protein